MGIGVTRRQTILGIGAAALAAATPAAALAEELFETVSVDMGSKVTATATEKVSVEPDVADIDVYVEVRDDDAKEAAFSVSELGMAVAEAMVAAGAEKDRIQSNAGLSQTYIWDDDEMEHVADGYQAYVTYNVNAVPIDGIAAVVSAAIDAGATSVSSVRYRSSAYDDAYLEALAAAVETARHKAAVMATALGCSIGDPIEAIEGYQNDMYRYTSKDVSYMNSVEFADDAGSLFDIAAMPGLIEIEATVTASFDLVA